MIGKTKKYIDIPAAEKALLVADWLVEKKAARLWATDVTGICPVADAIMVASAKTSRHARSLADHILDMSGEHNLEYLGMEGHKSGEWILVDLNDVVVHIFHGESRDFYDIESLWPEGRVIEDVAAREEEG